MPDRIMRAGGALLLLLGGSLCFAATVNKLSFEEMTDTSEVVATGTVTRSWTAWDDVHRHIWTHYELSVSDVTKGARTAKIDIAEPGGVVGDVGETIAGTVAYQTGENVMVFLQRMPNGYLRTAGWGQGKFSVDGKGMLHSWVGLRHDGMSFVNGKAATSVQLEGTSLTGAQAAVLNRIRTQAVRKVQ